VRQRMRVEGHAGTKVSGGWFCWALFLLACGGTNMSKAAWVDGPVDVLVLAPHPDDELLMAGGVIRNALLSGRSVAVAVVTNGDQNGFLCLGHSRNGYQRQKETVDALSVLGLPENRIVFLGYPDGGLRKLQSTRPLSTWRFDEEGICTPGHTTYGRYGAAGRDAHSAWYGTPAPYTSEALAGDLKDLLTRLKPLDIYLSHPQDSHPDHHLSYVYLRRALNSLLEKAGPGDYPLVRTPVLHGALVHAGKRCWPSVGTAGTCEHVRFPAMPGIETPLRYPSEMMAVNEELPVPAEMLSPSPKDNLKFRALEMYHSQYQNRLDHDWMAGFIRSSEVFYREQFTNPDDLAFPQ
jgi:LmbE family N-acetylglucosaminyl deacetylase